MKVQVENLNFKYGKTPILSDINFEITQSGIYGLIGRNGSGKTTLLELISSIKGQNYDGEIKIDTINQHDNIKIFRQYVGILFQAEEIEPRLTVLETFDSFKSLYTYKTNFYKNNELLEMFNLLDQKNKKIKELSGGLQQRVKIAITCMSKPNLILLDEPTTGLDAKYRKDFWKTLNNITQKNDLIVILSSHDMHEVEENCAKVMYLRHGRINVFSSINSLLEKNKLKNLEDYYLKMEEGDDR
ncbi:ABC transporter, ATPase component [Lactiplantibacillus pentosus KCA1]|nr:ABC transporter ATP-binding protein [Lactiplantibacillus pentosus]EIW13992.1 ABC transporter, ATPase component [Lactiplantibacillus pentosus KCA1]